MHIYLHGDIVKPVHFSPYTSIVMAPFLSQRYQTGDDIHRLHLELVEYFKAADIPGICIDNKTVFELEDKHFPSRKICIGFYDNQMNIGFSYKRLV